MDKEIVGLNGVWGAERVKEAYRVRRSDEEFIVTVGEDFVYALTNPLKTVDGTVGSHNRAHIHEKLDEWIDNAIKGQE